MRNCVMVAPATLTRIVRVRILLPQPYGSVRCRFYTGYSAVGRALRSGRRGLEFKSQYSDHTGMHLRCIPVFLLYFWPSRDIPVFSFIFWPSRDIPVFSFIFWPSEDIPVFSFIFWPSEGIPVFLLYFCPQEAFRFFRFCLSKKGALQAKTSTSIKSSGKCIANGKGALQNLFRSAPF